MKFAAAVKRLARIAKGEYNTVSYEQHSHEDGSTEAECTIYLKGPGHFCGKSWEEAFGKLDKATKKKREKRVPKNEAPGEELNPEEGE